MTPLTIYLWQQVDSVINFLELMAFPFFLSGFIGLIATSIYLVVESEDESSPRVCFARNGAAALLAVGFLAHFFAATIPSSKTIAMMVVIPTIANSEPIQKDLPELYQLAKDALKEQVATKNK